MNMDPIAPSDLASSDVRYRCIIRHVVPFGMFADVLDLNAKGLLRITEMKNPAMLQDHTCIGTEIVARVIGKEKADGSLILSQH
jgi:hypothetical protein